MTPTEIERAKDYAYEAYCSDDIDLDDTGIRPFEGEEGCWVAAWLWVPRAEYQDPLVSGGDEALRDAGGSTPSVRQTEDKDLK